jgi:hypothetical protein
MKPRCPLLCPQETATWPNQEPVQSRGAQITQHYPRFVPLRAWCSPPKSAHCNRLLGSGPSPVRWIVDALLNIPPSLRLCFSVHSLVPFVSCFSVHLGVLFFSTLMCPVSFWCLPQHLVASLSQSCAFYLLSDDLFLSFLMMLDYVL